MNYTLQKNHNQKLSSYGLEITDAIYIDSEDEMELYNFSGNGTEESPYIIENLHIKAGSNIGIHINGWRRYFIIQNCIIESDRAAIKLDYLKRRVIIRNNTCYSKSGIYIYEAANSSIVSNQITVFSKSILLVGSPNSTIRENFCKGGGIQCSRSNSTTIIDNECNYLAAQQAGISVSDSDYVRILKNRCYKSTQFGINLDGVRYCKVVDNYINDNYYGLGSYSNDFCIITGNIFIKSTYHGVYNSHGTNNTFLSNIFIFNYVVNETYSLPQALDGGYNSSWYNETTKTGNYWSDYSGEGAYNISYYKYQDLYPIEPGDSDNDTLDDIIETYGYLTDPYNNDTDTDFLLDGEELFTYLTDPLDKDTDNDVLLDGEEVYLYFTDPLERDTDIDGILDGNEILVFGTNATNPDTDYDLIPDGWEIQKGMNPLVNDSYLDFDADGLTNLEEYEYNTNPFSNDTDSDGLLDGEEIFEYGTSPFYNDSDVDGLEDGEEVLVYLTDPLDSDTDNDLLKDGEEVKIYATDPLNADTEGDGMPDGWEVKYALDPLVDDSLEDPDGDRLINIKEYQYGTNPQEKDTDGDGFDDKYEIRTNHDPLDPLDYPMNKIKKIQIIVSSVAVLSFCVVGFGYLSFKRKWIDYSLVKTKVIKMIKKAKKLIKKRK